MADAAEVAEVRGLEHGSCTAGVRVGALKPGGSGPSGRASTSTLNSSPIAAGSVRRNRPARSVAALLRARPLEQLQRPRLDAEGAQEGPLRHRAEDRGAAGAGRLGERPEIDLGREIRLARRSQRIGARMATDRLQRVAGRAVGAGAVVDQQCDAARGRDPLADLPGEALRAPG